MERKHDPSAEIIPIEAAKCRSSSGFLPSIRRESEINSTRDILYFFLNEKRKMDEKLQSLKPSRSIAPTIPSRRKKQTVQKVAAEKVKVKRERIQVKQEMTASGPFALGPAAAQKGSRISTTTTTVRQASGAEMRAVALEDDDEKDEKDNSSGNDDENEQEFGPRRIKPKKPKKLVNFGTMRPKIEKKPNLPETTTTATAKRGMVIDSDDEEEMMPDTAEATELADADEDEDIPVSNVFYQN
jgi:hypothetical protein